jgi:hypothetical protein
MPILEQIPKKSNLRRNVVGIFKTMMKSTGLRHLYQADCLLSITGRSVIAGSIAGVLPVSAYWRGYPLQ